MPVATTEWTGATNLDLGTQFVDLNDDRLIDFVRTYTNGVAGSDDIRTWLNNGCNFVDASTINTTHPLVYCTLPTRDESTQEDPRVTSLLKSLNLSEHAHAFANRRITLEDLRKLPRSELELVGVTRSIDQDALLSEIKVMNSEARNDKRVMLKFLSRLGLDHLIDRLISQDISVEMIPSLSDSDLEKAGVDTIGARKKIAAEAKKYQTASRSTAKGKASANLPCPAGAPGFAMPADTTVSLIYATSIGSQGWGDDRLNLEGASTASFVDLNNDNLPDLIVSYQLELLSDSSGGSTGMQCIYMNTGCGWVLGSTLSPTNPLVHAPCTNESYSR